MGVVCCVCLVLLCVMAQTCTKHYCNQNVQYQWNKGILPIAELQWCGNVIRTDDTCIPKQTFYRQL